MANAPLTTCVVKITAKDINGNNILKTFGQVRNIIYDFNDMTINILDVTGSFYFALTPVTSIVTTVVPNPNGSYNVVIS